MSNPHTIIINQSRIIEDYRQKIQDMDSLYYTIQEQCDEIEWLKLALQQAYELIMVQQKAVITSCSLFKHHGFN